MLEFLGNYPVTTFLLGVAVGIIIVILVSLFFDNQQPPGKG